MFDREERGNRAVILHPCFSGTGPDALAEFRELAISAGVEVVGTLPSPRNRPDARFYVGSGKADELAKLVEITEADLVLVSRPISAVQERNLESKAKCRVLDRTTLILDIFAQRARSYEGKLQVELAQLRHLSTRLIRGWTHLERQKGGIGLRGPGETQLETDRRLIGDRIRHLRDRLDKVGVQREQSRRKRQRSEAHTVALVGYTNAGKSTLFNRLTQSDVDARDMQFATLDPTVRQMSDEHGDRVLLADTVGFVSELPHELIAAFRATLLETREAELLLHVIDASDPFHAERRDEVEDVLRSVGAGEIPMIRVYNKIDLGGQIAEVVLDDRGHAARVAVSALTGDGVPELAQVIHQHLAGDRFICRVQLVGADARLRAGLFELGAVSHEQIDENGSWILDLDLPRSSAERLAGQSGELGGLIRNQLQQLDATGISEHLPAG